MSVKLLLQSCCAPCSTVALERLHAAGYDVTVFYCNPNIFPEEEYNKRCGEQKRLLSALPHEVGFIESPYDHESFLAIARGYESEPEEGARCRRCFELRMRETAHAAAERGFEVISSTITTGPRKRAADVNVAGEAASAEFGVRWLTEDFKKRDGYKRSIEISKEHELYRQNYCGCEFSMR